jgi:putative transposase
VRFISEHEDTFGVEPVCRVLSEHGWKIAPGTYYAAVKRPPSARSVRDAQILTAIVRLRQAGYEEVYGARKTWLELNRRGIRVARCTVERLMREHGLEGVRRGKAPRTTVQGTGSGHERAADLLKRDFTADAPNRRWVADFTYVATLAGTVYVAFVVDIFSRAVVGWAAARHKRARLVLDALDMALWHRDHGGHPVSAGLIHHSDAGSQYTSIAFTAHLMAEGILASIGTVGDALDNALMESAIGLYKAELINRRGPWRALAHVETATAGYLHWFNTQRIHGAIGDIPPAEHEAAWYAAAAGAQKNHKNDEEAA